ncbi:MAG TPA: hypothetical protein P5181_12110 [Dermatophilaceae bacterium]|nr:hypothetical protein [Dermatophilaceae bacterium]
MTVETANGVARVHCWRPARARGVVALGHGAGPSLTTVDLVAARVAAVRAGWAVALVEQPWLVAGGRVAARPPVLDAAWTEVVPAVRSRGGALATVRGPLVVAGRSAGARVACRTADALGAERVLCLSFPLHPPGRPDRPRDDELRGVVTTGLPVHVVQGLADPFGSPAEIAAAVAGLPHDLAGLHPVTGTHTIPAGSAGAVEAAVTAALG